MSYRLETRITPSGRVYQDYVFYGDPVETYGDTLESMVGHNESGIDSFLVGAAIGAAIGSLIDNIRAARKARKS